MGSKKLLFFFFFFLPFFFVLGFSVVSTEDSTPSAADFARACSSISDRDVSTVAARREPVSSRSARPSSNGKDTVGSSSSVARATATLDVRSGVDRSLTAALPAVPLVFKSVRDAGATEASPGAGTRTPAPQPLQRIFLPTSSALHTNFRLHPGHRNFSTAGATSTSPDASIGAGTTIVAPACRAGDLPTDLRPLGVVFMSAFAADAGKFHGDSTLEVWSEVRRAIRSGSRTTRRENSQTDGEPFASKEGALASMGGVNSRFDQFIPVAFGLSPSPRRNANDFFV